MSVIKSNFNAKVRNVNAVSQLEWPCITCTLSKKKPAVTLITRKLLSTLHQGAKKLVSDSPGLVDFAIRLVNSLFILPDGQVKFYEEFE